MEEETKLTLSVDVNAPQTDPDAITFETGATLQQTLDPHMFAYEHHGLGLSVPGALIRFYEDLIQGRPLPPKFVTSRVGDVDTLLAIALFLHRDTAISTLAPGLVYAVDAFHRLGTPFMGHLDSDIGTFILILRSQLPPQGMSPFSVAQSLPGVIGHVREYLLYGRFPHLGIPFPSPKVLDKGTGGFVLGEVDGPLGEGWVELFRQGHLRGLLISPQKHDRRQMLIARKSTYVPFNLPAAAQALNIMEERQGEPQEWAATTLWLHSPTNGTLLPVSQVLEVLLRV